MTDRTIGFGSPTGVWPPGTLQPADEDRFRRYAEAAAFAAGAQWLGTPRRGESRLTLNYARALVRKTAAYVFPGPVTFRVPPAPEQNAEAASRAETALAETIGRADLGALDIALCAEAALLGDAAVKITWDAARGEPAVAPVDPATLIVVTAADDARRALTVTQGYALPPHRLAELGWTRPDLGTGERALPVVETWTTSRWRVAVAGQTVRDGANPYGWIPYVTLPNDPRPHAFWGQSDLADLYDVCRELNVRLSTIGKVLELSGSPIAVLENVDGSEGIAVRPGATWELPEGARAYLLDLLSGGGVELHIRYVELLFRVLHDLSETPRTAFGDGGRDLSGAALEVEVQPLLQKVARKRRAWDAFFRERNARLLDLRERFGSTALAGIRQTEAVWPSVLPSDIDGAVQNAALLVRDRIHSRRTAVAALGGVDPEGEFARVLEEARTLADLPRNDAAAQSPETGATG